MVPLGTPPSVAPGHVQEWILDGRSVIAGTNKLAADVSMNGSVLTGCGWLKWEVVALVLNIRLGIGERTVSSSWQSLSHTLSTLTTCSEFSGTAFQ